MIRMADISDKKVASILGELEEITGFDYDDAKKMYEEYRGKGYSKVKSARLVWEKVMDDYFDILYQAEYTLDYKDTMGRFFHIISDITGFSYETILKTYHSLENNKFTSNILRKIWNIYMGKYFQQLAKKR
jgi:hypothetical protein